MRQVAWFMWTLGLAARLFAEEPAASSKSMSDPAEILRKSQTALKAVQVISYRGEYTPEGWLTERVPKVEGTATVGKQTAQQVDRFYTNVKFAKVGTSDMKEYTAGCDGNEYYLIDNANKIIYQDLDPAVLGSQSRNIRRLVLAEFGEKEPFTETLTKGKLTLNGVVSVDGEDCYEILVEGLNPPKIVWWISTRDFFPRQMKRILMQETKEGAAILRIISPAVGVVEKDKEPFKAQAPADFKKTGDFAP